MIRKRFPEEIDEAMAENDSADFEMLKRMLPQTVHSASGRPGRADMLKLLPDEHMCPDGADGLRRHQFRNFRVSLDSLAIRHGCQRALRLQRLLSLCRPALLSGLVL
jgi:hypothetical protein